VTDREQSQLRIDVVHDHDGDCSVTVTIKSGLFCGSGHAWLNVADVLDFAVSARQLAAASTGTATLFGGYVNSDGSPNPTVNLRFHSYGQRGYIIIDADYRQIMLVKARWGVCVSRMSAPLIVEPAGLERFAQQLSNIPKGAHVEAVVPGESPA